MSDTTVGRLTGIEASRGIAATVVVLYHVARHIDKNYGMPLLKGVFQFGHAGVDLFFVLSGFIILHVHYHDIGRPARLGHYLNRRFTRVMPIYWVALAMTIAMAAGGGLPNLSDLAWSVTLLPSNKILILEIAWTLRHEIVFYALFCILIINRTAGIATFGAWLILILLGTSGTFAMNWLPGSTYNAFNFEFFLGMAAAFALRSVKVPSPRLVLAIGLALFTAAALAEDLQLFDGYAAAGRLVYGLPAALIVVGVAASDRDAPIKVPRLLRTLGAASYSIYLFQFVFIGILWKLWLAVDLDQVAPPVASFPLLAAGGIAGGVLASRLIEYPLMRLIRGNRGRTQMAATVK
jgi:exopolysaccharide production protein ExoZ